MFNAPDQDIPMTRLPMSRLKRLPDDKLGSLRKIPVKVMACARHVWRDEIALMW